MYAKAKSYFAVRIILNRKSGIDQVYCFISAFNEHFL